MDSNEAYRIYNLYFTNSEYKDNLPKHLKNKADNLDKVFVELMNERKKRIDNQGLCIAFESSEDNKKDFHCHCSFNIWGKKDICSKCNFYNDTIIPIDEKKNLVHKASEYFINAANYDNSWP